MSLSNNPPSLSLSQESLARILQVTQKLAQPFDLVHLLTEVIEAGKSVLLADRGAVWLYDAEQHELIMKAPQFDPAPRVSEGEGLVGECLRTREIISVTNAYDDPRFQGAIDKATGYRTHCLLNVPLQDSHDRMIGVLQLLNKQSGAFDERDELVARTLAAQCAVAIQRTQLTEALLVKERLDEEVSLAREIQMSTLPTEMPQVPGYDVHGDFRPANHAGGDLFDLVILGGELFMLLGDATGHGFGPALSATQMQAMLRVAFRCGADLDQAYLHVNNQMSEDLPDDRFVTAFMGFLDSEKHQIRFHSGGQGPILHFHAATLHSEWHQPTTFPVGVLEMEGPQQASVLHMKPGDVLVVLSDGVYEFVNREGAQFGEERVANLMKYHHDLPMADLCRQIFVELEDFGGGADQEDDISMVVVKRDPLESELE